MSSSLDSIMETIAEESVSRDDNTSVAENVGYMVGLRMALHLIPDGWAKVEGEWRRVTIDQSGDGAEYVRFVE